MCWSLDIRYSCTIIMKQVVNYISSPPPSGLVTVVLMEQRRWSPKSLLLASETISDFAIGYLVPLTILHALTLVCIRFLQFRV